MAALLRALRRALLRALRRRPLGLLRYAWRLVRPPYGGPRVSRALLRGPAFRLPSLWLLMVRVGFVAWQGHSKWDNKAIRFFSRARAGSENKKQVDSVFFWGPCSHAADRPASTKNRLIRVFLKKGRKRGRHDSLMDISFRPKCPLPPQDRLQPPDHGTEV